ncbi:alpha/beta fold hydrolase, partial [Pseudomonas lurida]
SYGSVHCYKAIGLTLRERRPVMGVICRALAEEGSAVPSWQAMVEDYTGQLLDALPEGRYRLAGWSMGGNLAMEVAYALEQAGREVEVVGWIDASPPYWLKAYWDAAVIADDDDLSVNQRRVELLQVMFPASSQRIRTAWLDSQAFFSDEAQQWQALGAWAEEALGETFREIKASLLEGDEAQISWELD